MFSRVMYSMFQRRPSELYDIEKWERLYVSRSTCALKHKEESLSAFVRPSNPHLLRSGEWEVIIVDREADEEKYSETFERREDAFETLTSQLVQNQFTVSPSTE